MFYRNSNQNCSLISAISFALGYSNEIDNLSREFQKFDGSVELILNIQHNDAVETFLKNIGFIQIPKTISLRRLIHLQQIDYFIGVARVERVDVKNFLQTFGFAASYPFQYSIQSDDIATVETSNDKERLYWLKNCCGVMEFSEKRDKSMRVLKETEEQIRKIDVSLSKIDVQLDIFASNETQQIYHKWMLREKELGHFQVQYRIKKLRSELEALKVKMTTSIETISNIKNEIIQYANNATEIRREIKAILDRLNALQMNERRLELEMEQFQRMITDFEDSIAALKTIVWQGSLAEDLTNHEIRMYRDKMDETNSRVSHIDGEIELIVEKRYATEQQLNELESQVETIVLNCEQNKRMGFEFQSVAQRNDHLFGLIKKLKNAIARENRNANKMRVEMQQEMQELESLKAVATKYNEQLAQMDADNEISSFHQQQEMIVSLEHHKW